MLFKEFKKEFLSFNDDMIDTICIYSGFDDEVEYSYSYNNHDFDDLEVYSFQPILVVERDYDGEKITSSARLKVCLWR